MNNRKINWGIIGCANIAKDRVIPAMLQASLMNARTLDRILGYK